MSDEQFNLVQNLTAWKDSGVVEMLKWYSAKDADVCAARRAHHGIVLNISDAEIGVNLPPLPTCSSVRCRCHFRPEDISISNRSARRICYPTPCVAATHALQLNERVTEFGALTALGFQCHRLALYSPLSMIPLAGSEILRNESSLAVCVLDPHSSRSARRV
jgi:hypothetical protein